MNANKIKINSWCFDSENKEHVKITNGVELGQLIHFVATEAIALRVVGLKAGVPLIGFTYRKVNHEKLSLVDDGGSLDAILNADKPEQKNFICIGRI
jgi:hypothetical protein